MCLQWCAFACFCVHCVFLCFLTPSVGVLSVAPGLLKACVYNSFLSSKASSFDHTWFPSGCNEPQHLASTRKSHNQRGPMASWSTKCRCLKKGNWKCICLSTLPFTFTFMSFGSVKAGAYNGQADNKCVRLFSKEGSGAESGGCLVTLLSSFSTENEMQECVSWPVQT